MIVKSSLSEVTYPIVKLDDETYLMGSKNRFQIRRYSNDELLHEFKFNECGFSILKENIFFYVESTLIKYNLGTRKETLFFKSEANNEIWFFNELYLFEAKPTEVRREFKYSFYDILENKIKWVEKSTNRLSSLSKDYLLFTNILGTIYKRKNILDGTDIWTLDFSENKINGNVFLIENILVLSTINQDLIGVEIETGKELWRFKNINATYFQIQPNTNYLVSLNSNSAGDNWYYVINSFNGKILINKKFEKFYFGATGIKACITENHYYFISNVMGDGSYKDERITHLGCINLKTHEIEWIEKIGTTPDRRSGYQKPEYHNGKFYLLDGEQTLHIYQKI